MKTARFLILILAAGAAARADFSFISTHKSGAGAGAGPNDVTKIYLKGQKMLTDSGSMATIMDFEAQTLTSIDKASKTYTVKPFGQIIGDSGKESPQVQVDFKETGQHKMIGGFNATQDLMTLQIEMPQARAGMKMQMEMELWVSPDVPGAREMHEFYQRNMSHFPWATGAARGNPNMQHAMAEIQKRMAGLPGVPVLEIMRMKMGGNDAQAAQMQQGMAQARARLEAMAKQGGPQGDAARQALARMGAMGGGSGSLSETTTESSGFSTASIPDSVFALPAGFQKTGQ